jgi:hypothetical protein
MLPIRQIIDDAPETVAVPEALRHRKLEIIFRVVDDSLEKIDGKGWPEGFFERTAGAWQGEPLLREPQGEFEQRLELE